MSKAYERVERRKRQAEMLKSAKQIRSVAEGKKNGVLQRRFWQDVSVREVNGALGEMDHTATSITWLTG
jgi:ATP synthase mitochondrial F1 complex assembly factor 2